MRGGQKPFVMYQRGSLHFTILPRGLKGWLQFAIWMLLLGLLVLWFADHVSSPETAAEFESGLFLFLCGVIAWLVGGLWWMIAHSEVVDVVVLKREQQNARRRLKREQNRREDQQQPGS